MKTIPLTKGRVAIVDDCMYEPLMAMGSWYFRKYACRTHGQRPNRQTLLMHRVVMELAGFDIEGKVVDHRHGNRLDNRVRKLRAATHSQNHLNHQNEPAGCSGYWGVSWQSREGLWHARITVAKRTHSLGYFKTPVEAAIAYDDAAKRLCRDFAKLNFPEAA